MNDDICPSTFHALLNDDLGQLVNPGNAEEITRATGNVIENKISYIPNRKVLPEHFRDETYKRKLEPAIR